MIISVQGQKIQVPDGLSQAQIGEVVDHFVSTRTASAQQPTSATAAAPPQAAPASSTSPPPAQTPTQTPAGGGDGIVNDVNKMAQDYGNNAFMGIPEELGAKEATGLEYLGGVLTPGKGRDLADLNAQNENIKSQRQSALQAWNDQHEGLNVASQAAGALTTMGPLAKTLGAAAGAVSKAIPEIPGVTSALQKFATAAPKTAKFAKTAGTVSATGAGVGGVMAGAQAAPGDTEDAAEEGAGTGAGIGLLAKYAGEPLINAALDAVGPAVKSVKSGVSALQEFLKASEAEAPSAADAQAGAAAAGQPGAAQPSPSSPTLGFSTINNQPLGAEPPTGPVTGKLPLSPGVRAKDPNILRIEENAKQGMLGQNSQEQMLQSNNNVAQAAADAAQHLKGNTTASAPDLFEGAIQQFQDAGDAEQKQASALYQGPNGLNQSAAMTTLSKPKVAASLGTAMKATITDPDEVVNFAPRTQGQKLYQKLQNIIKVQKPASSSSGLVDSEGNPIASSSAPSPQQLPVNDLMAWRREVSDASRAIIPNSDTHAAGVLGSAFDDWMGSIPQDHVLAGDPDFAAKAAAASQGWKAFKTSFPQRASPFMPGEAKPFDMTPADHAAKLIGQNGTPSATAARQIRGMVAALPTDDAKGQYLHNVFSGVIDLASRGLNGDLSSLPNYRNALQNFRNSQLFREQYLPLAAKDPAMASKVSIIDNLIPELNQQIQQAGRRDVVSPSGGHTLRGIADMAQGLAHNGVGPFIPGLGEGAAIVGKVADMATAGGDRKIFQKSMKAARDTAAAAARSGPVFNIDSLKAGLTGGLTAGNMLQQNNGGTQ